MNWTFLASAAICAVGLGGMALARHDEGGGAKVTHLSRRDMVEKLDGKDARATVEEVAIEPAGRVAPHRHAGPVFGYVMEGEYEHALNDDPITTYKAGDTFYEPSGCVHRVTRNPNARQRTRLLAVILHPREAEKVTVPEGTATRDSAGWLSSRRPCLPTIKMAPSWPNPRGALRVAASRPVRSPIKAGRFGPLSP